MIVVVRPGVAVTEPASQGVQGADFQRPPVHVVLRLEAVDPDVGHDDEEDEAAEARGRAQR